MPSATQKFGFEGVEQLLGVVNDLPDEIRHEVLAPIVAAGGKVVQTGARFLAPKDEGDLEKSIEVVVRKYPKNFTAIAVIGAESGYERNGKRPRNYAHLQEFGHVAPDGTWVPATPFMRPAMETAAGFVAEPMAAAAEKALDRVADKLVRRYGHKRST